MVQYDLKIQVSGQVQLCPSFDFYCFVITWLHLLLYNSQPEAEVNNGLKKLVPSYDPEKVVL